MTLNLSAINGGIELLNEKLKTVPKEQQELYKKLDIELKEQFHYLDINAQSFASGKISLELSQFLYNSLRDYDNTTLSQRIIISEVMMKLIKERINKIGT